MQVIRFAILLAAVFILVPADSEQREHLWQQSKKAAAWVMTACKRNPQTCKQANKAWSNFKDKGARSVAMLNEMIRLQVSTGNFLRFTEHSARPANPLTTQDKGTLRQADFFPKWRGHLPSIN